MLGYVYYSHFGPSLALQSFYKVLNICCNIQGEMRSCDMSSSLTLVNFATTNAMASMGYLHVILLSSSLWNTYKMGKT